MIELLTGVDQEIFIFINHLPHNIFSDYFFAFFSGVASWGVVWFVIGISLFVWEEITDKKGLVALLLAGIIVLITIEVGAKYLLERPRPEFVLNNTIVVLDKSASPSFPSGHAAMAFAAAYILAKEHKRWQYGYYSLAFLIAFSRIYLGKHYPSDVLMGAILGLLVGVFSLTISTYFLNPTKSSGR